LSSRRVKKGPGRRPQSAKRQWFVELRERGWSILAAAREVGASRTAGNNWSRGHKTYRNGQVTGFVSALERLAVRIRWMMQVFARSGASPYAASTRSAPLIGARGSGEEDGNGGISGRRPLYRGVRGVVRRSIRPLAAGINRLAGDHLHLEPA